MSEKSAVTAGIPAKSPDGLGADGRAFWGSVTSVYALNPAELVMLERAARLADRLAAIDVQLEADGLTVQGSTGQTVAHPLLRAADQAERTMDVLVRSLALPLPGEKQGRRRSPQAVAAARARWDKADG